MLKYIKENVIGSLATAAGGLITVASFVRDAYEAITMGLPTMIWGAIGAAFLIFGMLQILYRHTRVLEGHRATSTTTLPIHYAQKAEVELFIDIDNFRAREITSVNVYDTTTQMSGKNGALIHIVFDQPMLPKTISVSVTNKLAGFSYRAEKLTQRFCAVRIDNIAFPVTISITVNGEDR